MYPRVFARAAAIVSLIAVFAYSLWLNPGADAGRATPAQAPESKPASTEPLPAPAGEPVLRVHAVSRGNVAGHTTAVDFATLDELDDYHVELPIADVAANGFLAVRVGGAPIEIADGLPIRLVFSSEEGAGSITDNWIWSIDSMRVIR